MESTRDTKLKGSPGTFSRRALLKGAAALTAAASWPEAFGQSPTGAPFGTVWLYISTYTGNPGGGGDGQGIYLCELNLSSGKLTVLKLVAPVVPSPMMNTQFGCWSAINFAIIGPPKASDETARNQWVQPF